MVLKGVRTTASLSLRLFFKFVFTKKLKSWPVVYEEYSKLGSIIWLLKIEWAFSSQLRISSVDSR